MAYFLFLSCFLPLFFLFSSFRSSCSTGLISCLLFSINFPPVSKKGKNILSYQSPSLLSNHRLLSWVAFRREQKKVWQSLVRGAFVYVRENFLPLEKWDFIERILTLILVLKHSKTFEITGHFCRNFWDNCSKAISAGNCRSISEKILSTSVDNFVAVNRSSCNNCVFRYFANTSSLLQGQMIFFFKGNINLFWLHHSSSLLPSFPAKPICGMYI